MQKSKLMKTFSFIHFHHLNNFSFYQRLIITIALKEIDGRMKKINFNLRAYRREKIIFFAVVTVGICSVQQAYSFNITRSIKEVSGRKFVCALW